MKILYHINSLYNPGGMERVTLNKVAWLSAHGHEVTVVTTDQKGRPTFFPLPDGVRTEDLGICYIDDVGSGILRQTLSFLRKRHIHRKRLSEFLKKNRQDIVVSLYPGESSFIPGIRDGSRKVLELHQNRYFHRQYANKGLKGIVDCLRESADVRMVRRFDRFVVLTEEDLGYWTNSAGIFGGNGLAGRITAIPNAVKPSVSVSDCTAHRAIAVGRLDYQKGFDRLVAAWAKAIGSIPECDWSLDIYGQGPWLESLRDQIGSLGIAGFVHLRGTTTDIASEYARSSMLVSSSHYEGFPMVMVEAMSCGLPVVSFDYPTGPKDIIDPGRTGILARDGDTDSLASAMARLMSDYEKRRQMGAEARSLVRRYSEESVMGQWTTLFEDLLK